MDNYKYIHTYMLVIRAGYISKDFYILFPELDDGSFNPLWATRGFSQSFHFWKESRRQQSTPLNAFLTYVTLPWWSIAKGNNFILKFLFLYYNLVENFIRRLYIK